jgi:DHA1 family bicyclomycin/chloramphenicol resistance-like MFS transporter
MTVRTDSLPAPAGAAAGSRLALTLVLAGLSMVGPFAIDTFLPSFPAIAQEFAISQGLVQQALSAYLFAFAGMCLFYGTLSDSFGRRRVILASLLLYVAASGGAALAPGFGWLLAARVLQGLAAGAGMVIGLAIVRDRFSGPVAQRMMAHITMVFGLAPAIAPVIGGYLHVAFGWRSVFVFLAAVGVILFAASWRWLDESLPPERRVPFHPATVARGYASALGDPRFVARTLACGFAFGGFALYIASAPGFVLGILRLPETGFAWLFVPMIGGMVGGSSLGGRLAHSLARAQLLRAGFACMGAAAVANVVGNAGWPAVLPWAVLPVMLYTFGLGLAMPVMNMMTMDLLPKRGGLAASLLNAVRMLVFSLVSGLVAPLLFHSALRLAEGMAAGVLLAAVFWWLGRVRVATAAPRTH